MNSKPSPIRAVVIDDSPTACEMITALLQQAGDIHVVGAGKNGQEAIELASRLKPDVITMDVHMPKMDGLEATRQIMGVNPTPIVIVTGHIARSDMDLTFEALRAGALVVVKKPALTDPESCDKLVQSVRLMAGVAVVHHWSRHRTGSKKPGPVQPLVNPVLDERQISIIGIATSTGGPAALATVLGALDEAFSLPILVVQHMTSGFTNGLAEWLAIQTRLHVVVAAPGGKPQPGTIFLAPENSHMQLSPSGKVELYKGAPYKGLRPSANYMFHSLAKVYGPRAAGVVLTGMGDDGAEGMQALHKAGGLTIAQDEKTSVVYGMPQEAALRGAVDIILPLEEIAGVLIKLSSQRKERIW